MNYISIAIIKNSVFKVNQNIDIDYKTAACNRTRVNTVQIASVKRGNKKSWLFPYPDVHAWGDYTVSNAYNKPHRKPHQSSDAQKRDNEFFLNSWFWQVFFC